MATISREEVANLARLARISMSDAELDHLAARADVLPTSHPLAVSNVTREDVVKSSLTPEQALSGAPASAEQRFKVPQILGEE